jgi:hypothetical protein
MAWVLLTPAATDSLAKYAVSDPPEYFPTGAWNSGLIPCGDQTVKAHLLFPDPFGTVGSPELYMMTFSNMRFRGEDRKPGAVPHVTAQGNDNTYCDYAHSDTASGPMARIFTNCWHPSSGTRIRSNYYASISSNRQPCTQ